MVEDAADLRATVTQALRLDGRFDVVADVGDAASAIAAAAATNPDVIVLDLGLPDLAGSELVARMREAAPGARIVVYTGLLGIQPEAMAGVEAVVAKDKDVRFLVALLVEFDREGRIPASLVVGPGLDAVGVARRFLVERCLAWGCKNKLDAAQLVLSELVTNALLHGGTKCQLRLALTDGVLHIQVSDDAPGSPDIRPLDDQREGGRGLIIVSTLSEAWGVDTRVDGKSVWAEVQVA